jgi:hypothetical protein
MTMRNVFWLIKPSSYLTGNISPLHYPAGYCYVTLAVIKAVTMKNAVFWDTKTHFVPHTKHITSQIQSLAG